MPIPQNPEPWVPKTYNKQHYPSPGTNNMRRPSLESIRTEDCEGPISELPMADIPVEEGRDDMFGDNGEALCSDRAELIERIKRGESPTWVPNQAVSQFWTGQKCL